METVNPSEIFRLTALAVFTVASIDLGIAFLMRAVRESTPDDNG